MAVPSDSTRSPARAKLTVVGTLLVLIGEFALLSGAWASSEPGSPGSSAAETPRPGWAATSSPS